MNRSSSHFRNHFHPAWLLVLLPPLLTLLSSSSAADGAFQTALGLRFVSGGLLLAALVRRPRGGLAGTYPRLLKELRAQLPAGLLAVVIPGVFGCHVDRDSVPWAVASYSLGCLLVGASAFGAEFDQRTLGALLAQPVSRSRVFWEKMAVAVTLIGLASLNFVLTVGIADGFRLTGTDLLSVSLVGVFAACSGPLFSLVSRSTLAGIVFAVTVPGLLYLGLSLGLETLNRWLDPAGETALAGMSWVLAIAIPAYLLGSLAGAWRIFARLELRDDGAGGRAMTGLHPLSHPVDRLLKRVLPGGSPMSHLVRKELRLHVVPWLVAGLMVALWALGLTLRAVAPEGEIARALADVGTFSVFAGLLGSLAFIISGTAAVAEERELGTLAGQLSQPASVRRQWLIKLAVATGLAITFGVLLPSALVWLSFDPGKLHAAFGSLPILAVAAYAAVLTLLLATSLYASSVARNTMLATATAIFIAGGLAGLVTVLGWAGAQRLESMMTTRMELWPADVNAPAWAPSAAALQGMGGAYVLLTATAIGLGLVALGGRNFRRLSVSGALMTRQLAGVALALLLALAIGALAFSQLILLRAQADQAEAYGRLRAAAVADVRRWIALGRLTGELAAQLGVPTNAPAKAVVEAVIAREGHLELTRITERFWPQPSGGSNFPGMDPALARRYGLTGFPATNVTAPNIPVQPAPPAIQPLDPVLRKRYGL